MSKLRTVLQFLVENGYTVNGNGNGLVINPHGKALTCSLTDGYLKFSVRTDFTSSFTVRVHKFVAYLKYGDDIFKKGVVVRHLNGVKVDNSWHNIAIGSQTDNMMDRPKESRKNHIKNKSVSEDFKLKVVNDRLTSKISYRKLVEKYNIPKSTIMDWVKKYEEIVKG